MVQVDINSAGHSVASSLEPGDRQGPCCQCLLHLPALKNLLSQSTYVQPHAAACSNAAQISADPSQTRDQPHKNAAGSGGLTLQATRDSSPSPQDQGSGFRV